MLSWCEIDLASLRHNLREIKKLIGPKVKLAAVVKSNAYGHGLSQVSRACAEAGADFLCVDNISEGLLTTKSIRNYEIPILILGGVESVDFPEVIRNNFRMLIYNLRHAQKLNRAAKKEGRTAKIFLKIDTGMHRLGVRPEEATKLAKELSRLKNLELEGVFSHFASSGEKEFRDFTLKQIAIFEKCLAEIKKSGIKIPIACLCNTAGALLYPKARFQMVRSGLAISGIMPSSWAAKKLEGKMDLKPALSFYTKIIDLKEIEKGERVGYGLTFEAKKKIKIAVLPVGYKDGYGRSLSNVGEVLVRGERCRVIGRICMRMTIIDVSKIKNVRLGEKVVLIGEQGRDRIEAVEVAEKMGTIPYEVLSRISESVPRIYTD